MLVIRDTTSLNVSLLDTYIDQSKITCVDPIFNDY